MCVIGNPPYSGESANKGEWIMKLMEDYKKEPGGKEKLKERNPKWINDDYVKFLRYGQHFIEKNGSGVLAFINPHGFLDNPTFRGMRWNLLKTYDKIYTIDLHGNAKKKETAPDGSSDINVFDIEQGVSINLFVKTGKKKVNELGKIFHFDLYGKREFKYDFLAENSVGSIDYKELPNVAPNYFFVNKDFVEQKNYDKGFSISELFTSNNVGIATAKDAILINFSKSELIKNVESFYLMEANKNVIQNVSYRLFDDRFIYYDTKIVERAREKIMFNFLQGKNIGLALCKQFKTGENYIHTFISNKIIESSYVSNRTSEITSTFPLYLYPETNGQQTIGQTAERTPNLNTEIVKQIAEKLGLTFTNEPFDYALGDTRKTFAPIDILDYIYAVLHSPTYRDKYKEFLKIDFPRVPYPDDKDRFWQLVKLGGELRQMHLLESPEVNKFTTTYPVDGDNTVSKIKFDENYEREENGVIRMISPAYRYGRVYINEAQYFDGVHVAAWEFYIGGYQPAQKWLKDRKGRALEFDDILHYQKIIVALSETGRLMKEIDKIDIKPVRKKIILFEYGADGGGASVIKLPNDTIVEKGIGCEIEDEDLIMHGNKPLYSWEAWWQTFTSMHGSFWIFFHPLFIHEDIKPFIQNALDKYNYPDADARDHIERWKDQLNRPNLEPQFPIP